MARDTPKRRFNPGLLDGKFITSGSLEGFSMIPPFHSEPGARQPSSQAWLSQLARKATLAGESPGHRELKLLGKSILHYAVNCYENATGYPRITVVWFWPEQKHIHGSS